jgi:hypothetical protein
VLYYITHVFFFLKFSECLVLIATNVQGFMLLDIYFRQPTTTAKFIIKCSLFVQKFKDAGQAETEDWLCF